MLEWLLGEHRLDAEPYGPDKAADDGGYDHLEAVALGLLDTLAPASKVLEVGAKLDPIFLVDPERCQDRRYRLEDNLVCVGVMEALLFSENLSNDFFNVISLHPPCPAQRLIILAIFSKPRFAK
jgi:hypothetical protein